MPTTFPHAAVDFETYYDREYSIHTYGNYGYIYHPTKFDCYLVAIHAPGYKYCGPVSGADWSRLRHCKTWVSHNMSFDALVARRLGIPLPEQWYCTADLATYLHAPRKLQDACWQLMSMKVTKAYRGTALGKTWSDFDEAERKEIVEAGEQDARMAWELWNRFNRFFPQTERDLSVLTAKMGWRGVAVNVPLLEKNMDALEKVRWTAKQKLPWCEDDPEAPVYSRKRLAELCREEGIWCPKSIAQDSEIREAWELEFSAQYPWVRAMRDWMKANVMYKKLEKIKFRLTPEGRFPYSLFYFGAHTGRWAGSGGFNMQNLNNTPTIVNLNNYEIYWPELNHTVELSKLHSVYLRHHFVPAVGKKFIICDLSQIEPRVAALLADDQEFLDFVRSGKDPYVAHALTMGWEGEKLEGEERKAYKAQALGLGYGCGVDKYIAVAAKLTGLTLTQDESRRHVKSYRAKRKYITRQWEHLDDALWDSVRANETYKIVLPNGRELLYFNLHRKLAKPRNQIRGNVVRGGKSVQWYGAKVWENVVQAVSRDVFAEHLLEIERTIDPVVIQAHDEAVVETDLATPVSAVEDIMSRAPDWLPGLPVASEGMECMHYTKG